MDDTRDGPKAPQDRPQPRESLCTIRCDHCDHTCAATLPHVTHWCRQCDCLTGAGLHTHDGRQV